MRVWIAELQLFVLVLHIRRTGISITRIDRGGQSSRTGPCSHFLTKVTPAGLQDVRFLWRRAWLCASGSERRTFQGTTRRRR